MTAKLKPLVCPDCECKAKPQPGTTFILCRTCNGKHYVQPQEPEYQQVFMRLSCMSWIEAERNMQPPITVYL